LAGEMIKVVSVIGVGFEKEKIKKIMTTQNKKQRAL
jgi:hypothetical protein